MKQKGGILLSDINKNDSQKTFLHYVKHSNIEKMYNGSFGITFKLHLIPPVPSGENWTIEHSETNNTYYYKDASGKNPSTYNIPFDKNKLTEVMPDVFYKMSPDNTYKEPITSLVVKICLIDETNQKYNISNNISLNSIKETELTEEINIQTDIFFKSYQYLQPICPAIVYADILTNTPENNDLLQNLYLSTNNNDSSYLYSIHNLYRQNIKIGIIVMGLAEGYETFDNLNTNRHFHNYKIKNY